MRSRQRWANWLICPLYGIPHTGIYQHFGLAQKLGPGEANRTLSRSHVRIFQEWLCFNLEQQRADVTEYLRELGSDPRQIIANWLRLEPYQNWMPASSREAERRLFLADLEIVSELIRTELGVASPDRDL